MPGLALILTTVIWAATFPATKLALQYVPPLSFLFLRFLASTLAVAIVLLWRGKRLQMDRQNLRMAGIASIFLAIGYVTQTIGLRYTTASNSAFITALYVVFVPLFLGRFSIQLWTALGLALAGLWLLVRPSGDMSIGDVYTVICAVAFALHIISMEFFAVKTEYQSLATWQLIMVTAALFLPAGIEGYGANSEWTAALWSPQVVGALIITGVLATGLAFLVQVWAQRHVPAQRVALIFALEPALSAWMASLMLGEHLDALGWTGSALILAGVVVGTTAAAPHPHDPLQP
jgi:drug/metabolite transporter (DMT)-like permease